MINNITKKYPNGRGYLYDGRISATQLQCSKNEYIKKYILGETFSNKYTEFGKAVHKEIETGIYTIKNIDVVSFQLERKSKSPVREYEFSHKHTLIDKEITLNGIIDYYDKDANTIIDMKCVKDNGRNNYKMKDVVNNIQLDFYSTYHYLTTGKEIECFGIQNIFYEETNTGLELTGEVSNIVLDMYNAEAVDRTFERIAKFIEMVESITEEDIKSLYNTQEIPNDIEKTLKGIAELKTQIEALEQRLETEKCVIIDYVVENNIDNIKTPYISVYKTERKKYEYPSHILSMEEQLKTAKKECESQLLPTITKTFNFK